jgi:glycosyltransferase involved in cell wall biosynthesis
MKICFIFSNFHLSHLTGQPGIVFKLAKRAAKKGKKVFIISNDEAENKEFKKEGIYFFLFKGLGDFKAYLLNLPRIIKYLKQIKPDIIHVHGGLLIIYVWFVNRIFRLPMTSSLCETLEAMCPFYRKLFAFCLNQGEKTFVSSEYIKNQLVKNGVSADKILVVRIGVDEKFLAKMENFSPDTDILYFGDSKRNRGFDLILRLAQKLPSLKFKVLLRWQGRDCDRELEKMKKLSNVTIWHYPYLENLEEIILKSKLVALPFRWTAVRPPISLLEPMALGKCVLTSSMEGNEEVIRNGYNGLIVNFNKLEDVVSKISFLIKNDQVREGLGQKAKKTIRQMYSLEEYNKILNYCSNLFKKAGK